jgi:hypothetical protein
MLLQEAETGANNFGFVVEAAALNEAVNHPLEMGSYYFTHDSKNYNSLQLLSN